MLGSPILYLKGMRIVMFQLSGFYCIGASILVFEGEAGTRMHDPQAESL